MKSTNHIDVSICIVNWNTRELLLRCIRSIKDKTSGVKYEIVIVDNNSGDDSVQTVKSQYPDCLVVESKKNLGFAKGNNVAVKEASGKYILYLNPDTELITNAIYGMFFFLEKHDDFGAVGCKLIGMDGNIQFTCARTFPSPFNQFSFLVMLDRLFPRSKFFSTIEMHYWDHRESRQIDCLSGACIMARKEIIDTLNGFDENLFMYAEDVDLCYRIQKGPWKIYYLAEESIYHHEGASSKKKLNRHFNAVMQRASNHYFLAKHFGRIKAIEYRLAVGVGSLVRLFVLIFLSPVLFLSAPGRERAGVFGRYYNLLLWSMGLQGVKH
jgi:GT2 family glycosyltransferase